MFRYAAICLLLFFLKSSVARPSEPTRFTLSTAEGSTNYFSTEPTIRLPQGKEFLGRVADAIRIGRGRLVNSVTLARNLLADRTEQFIENHAVNILGAATNVLDQKRSVLESIPSYQSPQTPIGRETVRLENETAQSIFEIRKPQKAIESALENFLRPTPLVDGIKEEEKYGNSGDKFIGIGRALVNSFEGFSNFLNAVVELPNNFIKQKSRGITDSLNQLGARLVGLQK